MVTSGRCAIYLWASSPGESANIEYIKEDGKRICDVRDVILYTGRYKGETRGQGDIAKTKNYWQETFELGSRQLTKYKKLIGRMQMVDLINIEFTEGRFVGLSVLGEGRNKGLHSAQSSFQSFDLDKIKEFVKEYEGHFQN